MNEQSNIPLSELMALVDKVRDMAEGTPHYSRRRPYCGRTLALR